MSFHVYNSSNEWLDDLQSTAFESYQDNGRLIMKGCLRWESFSPPINDWKLLLHQRRIRRRKEKDERCLSSYTIYRVKRDDGPLISTGPVYGY